MPELPDITVYIEAIQRHLGGHVLEATRVVSPFLVRSVEPPVSRLHGRRIEGVERLGKRIVIGFEDDLFVVLHLMIAGRLAWGRRGAKPPAKRGLAAFDFDSGTLVLTEAGTRKRASLYVVGGRPALAAHDSGGLEVLETSLAEFREALTRENHTLKRSLTDPRILSGIGNAYSDEILHRARLSPVKLTNHLDDVEIEALHVAARTTLSQWIDRLRGEAGGNFPAKVTAFRAGMAVHGRHREPCPDCGAAIQRIVHANSESNYCPGCQTGGRLLADRALSRLLKRDWPKTAEELEERRSRRSS